MSENAVPRPPEAEAANEPAYTPIEHRLMQDRLTLLAGILEQTDREQIRRFIESCQHSEGFGCYVDPTLWMKGVDKLRVVTEIAQALLVAKDRIAKAKAEYFARGGTGLPGER